MSAQVDSLIRGVVDDLPSRINVGIQITPEHYALEKESIWRRAWMSIGHTQDVPNKGSYFVYDIPTFNYSLIVVRGQDDQVRIFHNICRHRGNKLVREPVGTRAGFTCNFHGWSFNTQGDLRLITDVNEFEKLDKEQLGMFPVHTEIWNSLIFINLAKEPHCTLKEWLGEMYGQYDNYFENQEKVASFKAIVNTNWHLAVNAFTEGYHTLYLHKSTARDYQGGKSNPQRHRPHMDFFDRHHRYSAPGNPDKVFVRGEKLAAKYGKLMIPAFDFNCEGLPLASTPPSTTNGHLMWLNFFQTL